METVYFANEHVTIYYDAATRTGRGVWVGFLSNEDLREPVRQGLKLIAEEKPVKWLADNRKLKAIRQQDQEWLQENMMPALAVSSLRKMASLITEDIFGQMAIDSLYSKATHLINFDHHYFTSEAEAYQWLEEDITENNFQLRN
ncbi:STAS/SEC14 domain-containing protein [Adhaeribacter aquaticus]|uniref:STAS/SEC14 domain-containing protein n=1 Tax=Adhaeribacter aquaticus TaxID=299567 RepID=UPI00041FB946|nr:STAS/SEC14 domain-containing protein [Adhaeribacter aquaticus]